MCDFCWLSLVNYFRTGYIYYSNGEYNFLLSLGQRRVKWLRYNLLYIIRDRNIEKLWDYLPKEKSVEFLVYDLNLSHTFPLKDELFLWAGIGGLTQLATYKYRA